MDLQPNSDSKRCPKCGQVKSLFEFAIRKSGRIGQPVSYCKDCNNAAQSAANATDDTLYRRVQWPSKIKRQYGITPDDYYAMLAKQGGGCAICASKTPGNRHYKRRGKPEMFHIDHCHQTGKVRGLLCQNCNVALGLLRDDRERLLRAAEYLGA